MTPHPYLGDLLDETRAFLRRFVVVGDRELDTIALWNAHTYVYETASATPYLHPYSPEPGSGKTTLLDVLELTARNAIQADNLTEAVLFRMIDAQRPTLLFDEVDAVFGKKNSDSTEGIRQVLNSGYRKGKVAWRCVPPTHEAKAFDVYCPKATAGLNELPATLAHRSIPISMKPPRPSDVYEDLDREEVEAAAETLRINLQSWADESEGALRDPRLKPPRVDGLDARGNEIWRVLFRIADLAGADWPDRARRAALELSGDDRRHDEASAGKRLLADIRSVFDGDRMTCAALVDALNALEESPWGGWNDQVGIRTRELGKKLAPYGIRAKSIRLEGGRTPKGYEHDQFEDAWSRYLPVSDTPNRHTATTRMATSFAADSQPPQDAAVAVPENGANPHRQTVVAVVAVENAENSAALLPGDPGYPLWIDRKYADGHITEGELRSLQRGATLIHRRRLAVAS